MKQNKLISAIKTIYGCRFIMPILSESERLKVELEIDSESKRIVPNLYISNIETMGSSNIEYDTNLQGVRVELHPDKLTKKLLVEAANEIEINPSLVTGFYDEGMRSDWRDESNIEKTATQHVEAGESETWGSTWNPVINGLKEATSIAEVEEILLNQNIEELVTSSLYKFMELLAVCGLKVNTKGSSSSQKRIKLSRIFRHRDTVYVPTTFNSRIYNEEVFGDIIRKLSKNLNYLLDKAKEKGVELSLAEKLGLKPLLEVRSVYAAKQRAFSNLRRYVTAQYMKDALLLESEGKDGSQLSFVKQLDILTTEALDQIRDAGRTWNNITQALRLNPITVEEYDELDNKIKEVFVWKYESVRK